MRIATKINIFFLVVVLALAAFSMSFFYFVARENLQNEIHTALELTAVSRARHVEDCFRSREIELRIIADSRVVRDLLVTPKNTGEYFKNFKRVEKRLNGLLALDYEIISCSVLDPKGRVAASTDKAIIGSDQSADPAFSRGKKAFYASRVHFSDRADKKSVLDLSMPIVEKGKFLGVIVHELAMSRLWKITTDRTGLGETGEIYIVNRDGYMITPSRFVKDAVLRQKVDTLNFRLSASSHKDAVEHEEVSVFRDYRGVRVLGAHEYIPVMEWSLLAEIDADEAFAPLVRLRTAFIFVLLFIPVSIWLLLNALVSRIVTRPITKLQNGVERVAAGELDFRVGTKEKDEIGALSREFDEMTESLKKSTTSIGRLNDEITARKQAEEDIKKKNRELEKLYKIKSKFTSMVSHELRTPLTSIKEGIGIVLDGTAGGINDDQENFLELAKRNVDRLHRLINDVLDFSKLEAGKIEFKMQKGDLLGAVNGALNIYRIEAQKKGLYLKTNFPRGLPEIYLDSDRIIQVLGNLLTNAMKFTKKGGITVSVAKEENKKSIKVCVEDTGGGIAKEDISKLFQKFQQLKNLGERKTGGTGLGLAICKEIIEQHKGKIWVESKIGEGSKFCFTLPI